MANEDVHKLYYKDLNIGVFTPPNYLRLYDPVDIFLDNLDKFDSEDEVRENLKVLLTNLNDFLRESLPEGVRYIALTEQAQSVNILDLIRLIDEFPADLSVDKTDSRRFAPVPSQFAGGGGEAVECAIPDEEFRFHLSARARGARPSSFPGFFDKFTAVLEDSGSGPRLRYSDFSAEIGNVLVKTQNENYPLICVNEAFCMGLAEKCGIEVMRRWLVKTDDGWGPSKQLAVERFGVAADAAGRVHRDLILDTGVLLKKICPNHYAISSENYIRFLRTILPEEEIQKFLRAYLFGYITGNSDMHVKNFSVIYEPGTGFRLTPMYDLVSYKPYPGMEDMALTVAGRNTVSEELFFKFITDEGLAPAETSKMCRLVLENLEPVRDEYIDAGDRREAELFRRISGHAASRAAALLFIVDKDVAGKDASDAGEKAQDGPADPHDCGMM